MLTSPSTTNSNSGCSWWTRPCSAAVPGRPLVEAIIAHARSLDGVRAVALTTGGTWESAHGLYRKTGFRRVPERDWFVPDTDIKLLVFRLDV